MFLRSTGFHFGFGSPNTRTFKSKTRSPELGRMPYPTSFVSFVSLRHLQACIRQEHGFGNISRKRFVRDFTDREFSRWSLIVILQLECSRHLRQRASKASLSWQYLSSWRAWKNPFPELLKPT